MNNKETTPSQHNILSLMNTLKLFLRNSGVILYFWHKNNSDAATTNEPTCFSSDLQESESEVKSMQQEQETQFQKLQEKLFPSEESDELPVVQKSKVQRAEGEVQPDELEFFFAYFFEAIRKSESILELSNFPFDPTLFLRYYVVENIGADTDQLLKDIISNYSTHQEYDEELGENFLEIKYWMREIGAEDIEAFQELCNKKSNNTSIAALVNKQIEDYKTFKKELNALMNVIENCCHQYLVACYNEAINKIIETRKTANKKPSEAAAFKADFDSFLDDCMQGEVVLAEAEDIKLPISGKKEIHFESIGPAYIKPIYKLDGFLKKRPKIINALFDFVHHDDQDEFIKQIEDIQGTDSSALFKSILHEIYVLYEWRLSTEKQTTQISANYSGTLKNRPAADVSVADSVLPKPTSSSNSVKPNPPKAKRKATNRNKTRQFFGTLKIAKKTKSLHQGQFFNRPGELQFTGKMSGISSMVSQPGKNDNIAPPNSPVSNGELTTTAVAQVSSDNSDLTFGRMTGLGMDLLADAKDQAEASKSKEAELRSRLIKKRLMQNMKSGLKNQSGPTPSKTVNKNAVPPSLLRGSVDKIKVEDESDVEEAVVKAADKAQVKKAKPGLVSLFQVRRTLITNNIHKLIVNIATYMAYKYNHDSTKRRLLKRDKSREELIKDFRQALQEERATMPEIIEEAQEKFSSGKKRIYNPITGIKGSQWWRYLNILLHINRALNLIENRKMLSRFSEMSFPYVETEEQYQELNFIDQYKLCLFNFYVQYLELLIKNKECAAELEASVKSDEEQDEQFQEDKSEATENQPLKLEYALQCQFLFDLLKISSKVAETPQDSFSRDYFANLNKTQQQRLNHLPKKARNFFLFSSQHYNQFDRAVTQLKRELEQSMVPAPLSS